MKNNIENYSNRENDHKGIFLTKNLEVACMQQLKFKYTNAPAVVIIYIIYSHIYGSCHYASSPEFQSVGLGTWL